MAMPVPDDRWAHEHDACRRCGTTETPHHAKGYCKPCAVRVLYTAKGWPKGLRACTRCGCSWSEVGYRSRGLCNRCWDEAAAANELSTHARKQGQAGLKGGQLLARQLVDLVGVSQAARDLHVPKPKFVAMVKGKVHVSQAMARRITKTLREYQR